MTFHQAVLDVVLASHSEYSGKCSNMLFHIVVNHMGVVKENIAQLFPVGFKLSIESGVLQMLIDSGTLLDTLGQLLRLESLKRNNC